jgi:hypothetical protein
MPHDSQWFAKSVQPAAKGVSYVDVKPLGRVATQCPFIRSTIPSTGSTALRKLALSRSRCTIPKPSAQCSKMPMITSGSPREPKNEQQDAGHSQSSCSIARELAALGHTVKRPEEGARSTPRALASLLTWRVNRGAVVILGRAQKIRCGVRRASMASCLSSGFEVAQSSVSLSMRHGT